MADGSRNPGADTAPRPVPMSPNRPRGPAGDRDKAVLHTRGSGEDLISELTRQQARISQSKNAPLPNRPVDPGEKQPFLPQLPPPLYKQRDKRTGPTPAPVPKQTVVLIWKKQKETIDNKVTYFDNLDGDHQLVWDRTNAYYAADVELTCGEHSGCLLLGDRDLNADIQTFYVEFLHTGIQSITISMIKPEKTGLCDLIRGNKSTANKEKKEIKREEEELQRIRESRRKEEEELQKTKEKLEFEINTLSLILDKHKTQFACNQQLNDCKREIEELKEQVEREKTEKKKAIDELAGHKNEERLRHLMLESDLKKHADYQTKVGIGISEEVIKSLWNTVDSGKTSAHKESQSTPVRSKDYVNLETANQRNEYYIEYKELEKTKEDLSKAKLESEFNSSKLIDYLHSEKNRLTDELTHTKRELAESNYEITKLRENLKHCADAPPIPARCPVSGPLSPRFGQLPDHLPLGHSPNPRYMS